MLTQIGIFALANANALKDLNYTKSNNKKKPKYIVQKKKPHTHKYMEFYNEYSTQL